MGTSLEDLLAEEGFKRGKPRIRPRTSVASEGRGMDPYRSALLSERRTRSHIPQDDSTSGGLTSRKPRDDLSRKGRIDYESGGIRMLHERRGGRGSWDTKRLTIGSSQDLRHSEITEVAHSDEIVEVGKDRPYKDVSSNRVYCHWGSSSRNLTRNEEREVQRDCITTEGQKNKNNSITRSTKQPQSSDKFSEDDRKFDRGIRHSKLDQAFEAPALDDVAVRAIISILIRHLKHFSEDEEFRASLHDNSFASLNVIGLDEVLNAESKVVANLEHVIEIVERAAVESGKSKELKRASLQLSLITGLKANETRSGFTSGIPNFKLSACAHLYLSVIYMLQKKDGITAKHLLQVFCDAPFQARTTLLPDLWEYLFLPHLLHLQLWYDEEARSLADSPSSTNIRLLEKVYNESLDSGTYQLATYYRDWITKGVEAPSAPLIRIPSLPAHSMSEGHVTSPASHISPQPMVSKKLYNEVFRNLHKPVAALSAYGEENWEPTARSLESPAPVDKQLIVYSSNSGTCMNQDFVPKDESPNDNLAMAKEAQRWHPESSSEVVNLDDNYGACGKLQGNLHALFMVKAPPPEKENKHSLEEPGNTVFESKQIEDSVNHTALRFLHGSELEPPVIQEKLKNYEDLSGNHPLCGIPTDFLCPLMGLLFKDPVTLETGKTFEREALTEWFSKGFLTCPVTRKTLQCRAVPPTNLILKRVIDEWKTNHFKRLLSLLSRVAAGSDKYAEVNDSTITCIFEQLLVVSSKDERIMHTKQIISFGGLQLLLRRFDHHRNDQEKTVILLLLLCCLEADAGCRNDIARSISASKLLELLHNEQLKARTNTVIILMELICLNRRVEVKRFLEGLRDEEIIRGMDDLLVYLETCPVEQTPLVAVLLLHLSVLSGSHTINAYRQEAVDALTITMERSLSDENCQNKCCRALLILGGRFSSSGKLMTEDWILKLAGFLNGPDWDNADNEAEATALTTADTLSKDDDDGEQAQEDWLVSLSAALLGEGKKSFVDTLSKCLSLGNLDFVRVCLVTVAWLSSSLASSPDAEIQLCAFSALIFPLKQCIKHGDLIEQRILACLSLFNFSKIPDCRAVLKKFGEEISPFVQELAEATWTAKELHLIISGI